MPLIDEDNRKYLTERFQEDLQKTVTLALFTRGKYLLERESPEEETNDYNISEEEACRVSLQLVGELAEIAGDKIQLEIHDVDSAEGIEAAQSAGVDSQMLPALAYKSEGLLGKSFYYGLPSGYEFGTLVDVVTTTSQGTSGLAKATVEKLSNLPGPLSIMVFVTPT